MFFSVLDSRGQFATGTTKIAQETTPTISVGSGTNLSSDGHKIYDPNHNPISTNPSATYRFSDPTYRNTGGDVYFGENVATSYFEVRQNINGKSLFVGKVEVPNILDLTDPNVLQNMNIDANKLSQIVPDGSDVVSTAKRAEIYNYTNNIANQAYEAGYTGIIYNSSRNTASNNRAVILFNGRYDTNQIQPIINKPIK